MATRFDFFNIQERINGSPYMLKYIVENREKDFYTNDVRHGMTPLILATLFCGFNIFKNIFNADSSSINKFDSMNGTAIVYAIIYGFRDKFDFLFEKGADLTMRCNYDKKNYLMVSVEQKDVYFLKKLLKLNIFNFDDESIVGNTVLMFAICNDNIEAIKLLLSYGANINYIPKKWKSIDIIKFAITYKSYRNSDLLQLLIENNANTYKPLIYYSGNKSKKFGADNMKILLEKGVSPNQSNMKGITPLMNAVKKKNFDTVKLLVDYGADIDAKTRNGYSILEIAQEVKTPKILNYLIRENNWKKRVNFLLFLRCFFDIKNVINRTHSRISNIDNIFALNKTNDMLRIIVSYL